METLARPDVTAIQKLVGAGAGLVTAIVALVNVFGWAEVDATEAAALLGVYAAFGSVLVVADAIIRNGRSRALANQPKGVVAEDTSAGGGAGA